MDLIQVLQGANVVLKLLQARLVTILALVLTFALYGWAMWQQTTLGAILCVAWGLTIFLPVLFTGRGGHDGSVSQDSTQHPESPPRGE
jgi:uncharacterized protein (DUF486 family)